MYYIFIIKNNNSIQLTFMDRNIVKIKYHRQFYPKVNYYTVWFNSAPKPKHDPRRAKKTVL